MSKSKCTAIRLVANIKISRSIAATRRSAQSRIQRRLFNRPICSAKTHGVNIECTISNASICDHCGARYFDLSVLRQVAEIGRGAATHIGTVEVPVGTYVPIERQYSRFVIRGLRLVPYLPASTS